MKRLGGVVVCLTIAVACGGVLSAAAQGEGPVSIEATRGSSVTWVAFGPEGATLLSYSHGERQGGGNLADRETTIHTWDSATGQSNRSFTLPGRPMSSIGGVPIALSPDGKRLAWQQFMGDLLIVDAVSGKVQQTIPRRSALAQRNDPRNAPQAQRQPAAPGQAGGARARLEAMKAQRAQQQAQGGGQGGVGQAGQGGIQMSRTILGLVFSPDGAQLAARTQGAVAMFDTTTGKRAILKSEFAWPKNELPQIVSIGFTGQAYGVACCTSDGTVRRYDTITGKAVGSAKIAIDGMAADAGQRRTLIGGALRGSAIFSPDGATIAALDKEGIALWDVASGKKLRTLPQPRTEVFGKRMSVSDIHNTFSPTGRLLVSPVGTSTIHVWDTQTGELKHKIELEGNAKIVSTAVSFYGNLLAAGDSTGTIRIWKLEAKTAEPVAALTGDANYFRDSWAEGQPRNGSTTAATQ